LGSDQLDGGEGIVVGSLFDLDAFFEDIKR
jgi:hypothetical protein